MTERIVIIGHGMVAARLVDELARLTPEASVDFHVTVIGEEPYAPYNRILLSEVLAGRAELGLLTLPAPPTARGMTLSTLTGVRVTEVDRARRVVSTDDGHEYPYDTVIFATGAAARNPLEGHDADAVRVLRTVDDCRELLAAISYPRDVAVVGGGLLGVEIACGLAARGATVRLLHRGGHVMDRQLPAAAGEVARAALADVGVEVLTGVGIEEVAPGESLVVAAVGASPRTELASAAGLLVRTGIVVTQELRSPLDPHVAAIGDCAEPPSGCPGLLAPGWAQAAQLARSLVRRPHTGKAPDPSNVVKLKAIGVDVLTIGAGSEPPGEARTIALSDPGGRRHVQVSVLHDRVVAACCVGAPRVAADLSAAYERRTTLPADPAQLLLSELPSAAAATAGDPTTMPAATTVCRCNGVTKKDIVDAHLAGSRDLDEVARQTRATTGCGGCADVVCGLLAWMDDANPDEVAQPKHARNEPGNVAPVAFSTTNKEIAR